MSKRAKAAERDIRRFVEIHPNLSIGIEVSTGRAWMGIDRQIGHGSADNLFALTPEQYVGQLREDGDIRDLIQECWEGRHEDLIIFEARSTATRPEHFEGYQPRLIRPVIRGEIWRHIDALGMPVESERAGISRQLADGKVTVTSDVDGIVSLAFDLIGENAYPRPEALIAGVGPGSTDAEICEVFAAEAVEALSLEGHTVSAEFAGDGLVKVTLVCRVPRALPADTDETYMKALSDEEEGAAFRAAVTLAGGAAVRWAASSRSGRRLTELKNGGEILVESDRVVSLCFSTMPKGFFRRLSGTPTRAEVHNAIGHPTDANTSEDLYCFAGGDVVFRYGHTPEPTLTQLQIVASGQAVVHRVLRWRSGDITRLIDVLGRAPSNSLVAAVKNMRGVVCRTKSGQVSSVELDLSVARNTFLHGERLIERPSAADLGLWRPTVAEGEHVVWELYDGGWIHARVSADGVVQRLTVSLDPPDGISSVDLRNGLG